MSTKSSPTWSRVRLELARSHEFPEGSTRHGYVVVLPLDANGRIVARDYGAQTIASLDRAFRAARSLS